MIAKTVRAFQARREAGMILEEAERRLLEIAASLDAEAEGEVIGEAVEKIMAAYGGIVGLRCIVGFSNIDAAATKGIETYGDLKMRDR